MIYDKKNINSETLEKELKNISVRAGVVKLEETIRFPKYFQLETIRLCNSHCTFCTVDVWDKSVPYIPEKLFEKVIEEMKDHNDWIEVVSVQRAGEPLLDKKITERIRRLKDIGIKRVNLSTNASLLTEDKTKELIDAGLDEIMFSIDSVDRETYSKMRIGLDFDTVVKNIRTFFRIRAEMNSNILARVRGISFYDVNSLQDQGKLKKWENFWNELKRPGDRIYMKQVHNWGNQKTWEEYTFEEPWVYHPCVLMWTTMHITTMGKIAMCPIDFDAKVVMGNLWEQTIKEIWQGHIFTKFRKLHSRGKRNELDYCQGCRLFDSDFTLESLEKNQ
ncbi:Predicted Fe-S oxidoreductase [Desulfamplus magnetovallimortis]|uniref:Predicted Fe-S oxidoreductase n=1 Tax=Desulfamplus magnetovallimortis TaxID=1246637 RepID=A0A1W1HEG8_9BACT|nr:radical SAM protein [Desulfamplus magnetovallimortis]SLM30887.1 Predicted Fe-S oxidoreductase [Desulfamplus magnetovallimortis]